MSFNSIKKKVLDKSRPMSHRRSSLRSLIQLCLYYTAEVDFLTIVDHYNRKYQLNSDAISENNLNKILEEITAIREASKQIHREYGLYRRAMKLSGKNAMSKSENEVKRQYWKRINRLWAELITA